MGARAPPISERDVGAPPGYGIAEPSRLQPHGPIYIGNNTNFTAANGVRQGTGTSNDPYVIRDWFIDGNLYPNRSAMVWIEKTDAYVVVENVRITNLTATGQYVGVQVGEWPEIVTTRHVTLRHIAVENSRNAYGIAVREGSSDVRVEANEVHLNATREWVYGAVAMRGTHNVTFVGNYIDAYTAGNYRTVGLHLSDFFVSEARDASRLVAMQNTIVNATAGGINSESSHGTLIRRNLVFMAYPGPKSVAPQYPRGIMTEEFSNETIVVENVAHGFNWGIQVAADRGVIASNTIYDSAYAVFVVTNGTWGNVTSFQTTIYNTTYWNISKQAIRLPVDFLGTVIDLGPAVRTTDLTPALISSYRAAAKIDCSWSGSRLNLSLVVGGSVVFDTVDTSENETVRVGWAGSLTNFSLIRLSPREASFRFGSDAETAIDGSGFLPDTTYQLVRFDAASPKDLLSVRSTSTGLIGARVPSAPPSRYVLAPDTTPPVTAFRATGTRGLADWYTSPVRVALTATDDLSGVQTIRFREDGGGWQPYAAAVTIADDGIHHFEYYSTDAAGNNETMQSRVLRIDATPPVLGNLTAPGTVTSPGVTIAWTGSDRTSGIAAYAVRIDEGPNVTTGPNTQVNVSLSDGEHVILVFAMDGAGNTAQAQTRIRVDTNIFSLGGPYSGIPSFGLIAVSAAATAIIVWQRYRRRARSPETDEPPDEQR